MTSTEIANASKIMLGSTEAQVMYIGSTQMWQQQQHSVRFLDILYSDSNGNLSYTSEVLPVSEGKTPIALCIAGEEFFGSNEKPRWMSLKYMNYTTPETGSLTSQGICWGNYNVDISDIANIRYTYNGGGTWGYLTSEWITDTQNKIPTLFDQSNEWNISTLGTVNQYTVTDIDGKNKTQTLIATATTQSTWRTDSSITNNGNNNYAPAACCCQRYHTLGTYAGNWYLGAGGEMSIIVVRRNEINSKLLAVSNIYPNDCISSLTNGEHWTSTEDSSINAYNINTNDGGIGGNNKSTSKYVIAILQYKPGQLPYDAEIEYLESTGTQYINTGIIANPGEISFEVDCTIENNSGSSVYTTGGLHYIYQSSSGGIRTGGTNNAIAYTPGNRVTIIASYNSQNRRIITIGNNVLTGTAYNAASGEFILLRIPKEPNCIGKLYSAKVYLNSILVRDMIPVRIGQVGYMYDKVSGQLFGNSGTGDFVLGLDKQ